MDAPSTPASFQLARLSRARTVKRDERPRWSEWLAQAAFVALLLLSLSGPWMNGQEDPALSALRQIGYAVILVVTLVALRPWRDPQRVLAVPWPLLLALGWCWLSLTWAMFPANGLRRLILTSIVLWSIFALVREIGHLRVIGILRGVMGALLLVNFAVVLLYPEIGIDPNVYEGVSNTWRGVMDQKNFAGFVCAVTALLFTFEVGFPSIHSSAGRVMAGVRVAVVIGSVVFLAESLSKTSMGIGIFAVVVGALLALIARNRGERPLAPPAWAWLPLALLAAVCVSMAIDPPTYLEMLSDPGGFTGRTQIWSGLIKAYADQPWFGVGYGSLWDVGPEGPMKVYARGFAADVAHGHNGYLDILVQIGGPGTMLVLFATIVWPLQRILRGGQHPGRVLAAAILIFCLGHNFTESSLLDRDSLGEVFLMIALALLWQTTAALPVRSRK